MRVIVLKNYIADRNNALSITKDEILTVTNQNDGYSWFEGENSKGQRGIFPKSNATSIFEPSAPPTEEDMTDDDSDGFDDYSSDPDNLSHPNESAVAKHVKNHSSDFLKKLDKVQIDINDRGFYQWVPSEKYTVKLISSKLETKFRGIKKFTSYQLKANFNAEPVSRRYKNFDWLQQRLSEKYCSIIIPPLPSKQISGRFEDKFLEKRMVRLQEFVDAVCRHPVLSNSKLWIHFITCRNKKQWKFGKRLAEKDHWEELTFCHSVIINTEKTSLLSQFQEQKKDFKDSISIMSIAVKNVKDACDIQMLKNSKLYPKDYERFVKGFEELSKSLEIDERRCCTRISLSKSASNASEIFYSVKKLYQDDAGKPWQELARTMSFYHQTIANILANSKVNCNLDSSSIDSIEAQSRFEDHKVCVLAEHTHFRYDRDKNLKKAMKQLFQQEIVFSLKLVEKLKEMQKLFE